MNSTSDNRANLPYRACVGIALLNGKGKVFVGRRNDIGGDPAWQMPQGGVDSGESPQAAALRELREETGVRSVRVLAESREWLTYDYPPELQSRSFVKRFKGQRQKWFAMRFDGPESEIDLGWRHAEFDAWAWREMEDLPELIVAFKRPVYEAVVREFHHLARPVD
jgi:putative (di)nucleoside polyphosphate hydrolase